uniref:Peptidase M1 leukotriene A4 hydrolase/aminopeptidase C-terminal domain-containing protein n=1 Tax=Aplanochytrium stocchinoi TaxID=215587 RepID=A0A7S3LM81_9STRA
MVFDSTSYSNGDEAQVEHMSLNLRTDFDEFRLFGTVVVTVVAKKPTDKVILDTRKLTVNGISCVCAESKPLEYEQKEGSETFGSPLEIKLPEGTLAKAGDSCRISIDYSTAKGDDCSALQWLSTEQTADKKHPFLFSQCQAIHARSLVPCMDAPGLKFTYEAIVTVPAPLTCLMSAVRTGRYQCRSDESLFNGSRGTVFSFQQKIPIPSYLLAICCGFLESREIGPRSHVWSEPSAIDACAYEFAETEKLLKIAEDILGPYEWGTYDLLVLPPSFPYGGMENPCLTFVTPTLLAGDRSLVGVVAHEISHSWTGNLVTNETWDDFWMNEGFTVFAERKIMARALGSKKKGFDLKSIIGWNHLQDSVNHYGCDHCFTCLHIDHSRDGGVDPDDAFSSVPYEKGFNFLVHLEKIVGGPSVFEPFLKEYIKQYRLSTVTPMKFRNSFEAYMLSHGVAKESIEAVEWATWLHKPGMPKDPEFDRSLVEKADAVGDCWAGLNNEVKLSWDASDLKGWTTDMIVLALSRTILTVEDGTGSPDCAALDEAYGFSNVVNSEVLFKWLTLCIIKNYEPSHPVIVTFLTKQGRMKFVRPLYRSLFKAGGESAELAISTFKQHQSNYHSICQKMVSRDLGISK